MKLRLIIVLATGVAFASACTVFGGSDSAPPPQSSSDASGGSPDGTTASTSDGSAPPDIDAGGPVDAGADVLDAAVPFACVGIHWLCDTFDRSGAINDLAPWGTPGLGTLGTLAMTPPPMPAPPSPPNALVSTAPGNDMAVGYAVYTAAAAGLRCDFSMRIRQRGAEQALLFVVSSQSPGTYYRVQFSASPDEMDEYGTFPDGGQIAGRPLASHVLKDNTWLRFTVAVKLGSGGYTNIGADNIDLNASSTVVSGLPQPTSTSIQLGVAAYNGGGTWIVDYDDVVCDPL